MKLSFAAGLRGVLHDSDSILFRSLFAVGAQIGFSEVNSSSRLGKPSTQDTASEWKRTLELLGPVSAEQSQCVQFHDVDSAKLFAILVDQRIPPTARQITVVRHADCVGCKDANAACYLNDAAKDGWPLLRYWKEQFVDPMSRLVDLAMEKRWAIFVDVYDRVVDARKPLKAMPV